MTIGLTSFLQKHALLAIWLVFLQWTAFVLVAWPWIRRLAPFRQLGWALSMALGLSLGLIANFQAFFILVVVLERLSLPALASLSLLLSGSLWALLLWCAHRRPQPRVPAAGTSADSGLPILAWLGGCAAIGALVHFTAQVATDVPGVFFAWDAVVSWNRWATEWSAHTPPVFTMGYPQLLPTGLASIYVWLGSDKVEPVARLFMLLFPYATCLLFWDGYRRLRSPAFLFGMACWLVMLGFAFRGMADSGYADVPVSFFVALAAYLLLLGNQRQLTGELALLGSAIGCAGALLTKQPGGIAWILWLVLVVLHAPLRRSSVTQWRFICASCVTFIALAAPWYAYTARKILQGTDVTNLGYLVATIHGDRNMLERLVLAFQGPATAALEGFGSPTAAAGVIISLLAFAMRQKLGRILVLGICLPYTLLWAALFSYDIRNIMPVIPILCLALGIGFEQVLNMTLKQTPSLAKFWVAPRERFQWLYAVTPAVVVAFFVLSALVPLSTGAIEKQQSLLQRQSQNPALNEALLRYARSPGFHGQVMTSYSPMIMIEELKPLVASLKDNPNLPPAAYQALKAERPVCEILALVPHWGQVRYILFHTQLVKSIIDRGLQDGSLHLELEQDGLRLVKVMCSA